MTQEDTDNINQIIDYFKKKQISAFIGSGFSKNANKKFKNWNELLYPLIDEMYEEEINLAKEKLSQNTEKNESDIKLNKIRDRIITRQGTTNIPEEYITYKGRREDLTAYIEENIKSSKGSEDTDLSTHKNLLSLDWVDICTTNYDTLLEYTNKKYDLGYNLVRSSSDLAQKYTKRIIKLHGSLRQENSCYNFDGSVDHQYIITKTDYDTYPKIHYGFTTFMQAKILQEAFCMIGFSGKDPNFKSWIFWVRDLLKNNNSQENQIPIYLLDVNETADRSSATELFYTRHNIRRLILSDFYDFLWDENHKNAEFKNLTKQKFNSKKSLDEFFKYIYNTLNPVNVHDKKDIVQNKMDIEIKNESFATLPPSRLPTPFAINNARNEYLQKIKTYRQKKDSIWELLNNCIQFSKHYLLLPDTYLKDSEFNEIEQNITNLIDQDLQKNHDHLIIWLDISILILKVYRFDLDLKQFELWKNKIINVLSNNHTDSIFKNNYENEISYQTCLFYANNLDLNKFDEEVSKWSPENRSNISAQWILKKAFLLNLFNSRDKSNSEIIKQLLQKAIEVEVDPQEKLWILENYSVILQGRVEDKKKVNNEIEKLKSENFISLRSITNYLTDTKKDSEIIPADTRRNKGKSIPFGKTPFLAKSLQYFYFIEESGLLLVHQFCTWDSINTIYPLFTEIQSNYLLQSICYFWVFTGNDSSENLLRKRGQDIIFADNNKISILQKENLLKKSIVNFDYRRKKDLGIREIFFLIGELIRTIDYSKWGSWWEKVWGNIINDTDEKEWKSTQLWFYRDEVWGWNIPINHILENLDNQEMVEEILELYLTENRLKEMDLSSIKGNPHYSKSLQNILKNTDTKKVLLNPENSKILEIFPWLKEDQKVYIISQINKNNLEVYQKRFLFSLFPYLKNDDPVILFCQKACINYINSLPENTYPAKFPIGNYLSAVLKIDKSELTKEILKAYKQKWYTVVKDYIHNNKQIPQFDGILYSNIIPYFDFIKLCKAYFSDIDGFNVFYDDIEKVVTEIRYDKNKLENIITGDEFEFEKIASQIILEQLNYRAVDYKKYIKLIINRIIYVENVKNENILFFLVKLFHSLKKDLDFMNYFNDEITLLLQKYKDNISIDHDRIQVEDHLIRIEDLFDLYIEDTNLKDYWKSVYKQSDYFEVRNLTKLYYI